MVLIFRPPEPKRACHEALDSPSIVGGMPIIIPHLFWRATGLPVLPSIDLMSFSGRFAVEETNRIRPPHLCVACGIAPVRGISRKIACCISKYLGARGDALAITVNQAFENCNTLNKTNFVRFYFARISITNLTTTLRVRLLDD